MKRGEIWTVAGANDYAGKPRPSVILQDEIFHTTESITVCGFTSDMDAPDLLRIVIEPTEANGLRSPSCVMIDKVTTIPRTKLGRRIGVLPDMQMQAISQAIVVFLRLSGQDGD